MNKILGIDGGSTKTEWTLLGQTGNELRPIDRGLMEAANYKNIPRDQLSEMLGRLPPDVTHVGVYLAGCATEEEHEELRQIAALVWPHAHISTGGDRSSALATAFHGADGIAVISGTGSAVQGCAGGRMEKAGGWGQLLGDRGSGYDLAMQGLRYCLRTYDLERRIVPLAHSVLAELGLNRFEDLVDWCNDATKTAVAKLAHVVFAHDTDRDITAILDLGAQRLAEYTLAVAKRLDLEEPQVRLLGGIFCHYPLYVEKFTHHLRASIAPGHVQVCCESASLGAAWLALQSGKKTLRALPDMETTQPLPASATEQSNPRSAELEKMSIPDLVQLFIQEEAAVEKALAAQQPELAQAVESIVAALQNGGRVFYIGAGTSGRLGVLDASEIPPTFGASPELFQGIIAGGFKALHRSVEGAEDRENEGRMAIRHRGVRSGDIVCGITASGRTPFVLAALQEARTLGAGTIFLTCNPRRVRQTPPWDVEIDLPTGPEVITGSTRLKAGTATKLALNLFSSCTMIRLGHVRGNQMIDLRASNVKLRDRAVRMVSEAAAIGYAQAEKELQRDDWQVRPCLHRLGVALQK